MKKINHIKLKVFLRYLRSYLEKIEENFFSGHPVCPVSHRVTNSNIKTLKLLISVIIEERHLICGGSVIYETSKNNLEIETK